MEEEIKTILLRIESKIDEIEKKMNNLEKSLSNMDRHISFVESFMFPVVNPFLRILRLR